MCLIRRCRPTTGPRCAPVCRILTASHACGVHPHRRLMFPHHTVVTGVSLLPVGVCRVRVLADSVYVQGARLDPARRYKVAITNYMRKGKEDFTMFVPGPDNPGCVDLQVRSTHGEVALRVSCEGDKMRMGRVPSLPCVVVPVVDCTLLSVHCACPASVCFLLFIIVCTACLRAGR